MKIYFAGAIRAGRHDAAIYSDMINFLQSYGEVLTGHVGDTELTALGDDGPNDRFIHDRDIAWLNQCDLVVAEVTMPSLGVGYELARSACLGKPVICLYCSDSSLRLSAMIAGSPDMYIAEYTCMEDAEKQINNFFQKHSPLSIRPK